MAQNIEHIEAKLCAYIDGMLDEVEAAEIEKHLAANPGHRELIDDLKRQRAAMVDLPREKAPPEVAEALMGQLERAVLLAPGNDEPVLRIRQWSQMMAVAAVLMLALGLGVVVYMVLPSSKPQITALPQDTEHAATQKKPAENQALAMKSQAKSSPSRAMAEGSTDVDKFRAKAGKHDADTGNGNAEGGVANAKNGDGKNTDEGEKLAFGIHQGTLTRYMDAALKLATPSNWGGQTEESNGLQQRPTDVFVVATADFAQTRDRVVSYLASNNIAWTFDGERNLDLRRNDTTPAPAAVDAADAKRLDSKTGDVKPSDDVMDPAAGRGVALRPGKGLADHAMPKPAAKDLAPYGAKAAGGGGGALGAGIGTAAPATRPQPDDTPNSAIALGDDAPKSPAATPAAPATQPADHLDKQVVANAGAKYDAELDKDAPRNAGRAVQIDPKFARDLADRTRQDQAGQSRARSVIVARGLNRQQVEELAGTLNREQRATVRAVRQDAPELLQASAKQELMRKENAPGAVVAGKMREPATMPAVAADAPTTSAEPAGAATRPAEIATPGGWQAMEKKLETKADAGRTAGESLDRVYGEKAKATTSPAAPPAAGPTTRLAEARYDCIIVLEDVPVAGERSQLQAPATQP